MASGKPGVIPFHEDTKPLKPTLQLSIEPEAFTMTGSDIRAYRKQLKFTQARLGEHLGVAGNTIARWERGTLTPVNPKMLLWALKGLLYELAGESKEVQKIRREVEAILSEMAESDPKQPLPRPKEKFGAAQ